MDAKKDLLLLYQMLLIRRFEEKAAELYTKAKIRGFLHLYIGEEATAVGVMQALTDDDNVFSTYREHGHALARGIDPDIIMAEMYGKLEGCSRGRGSSMHLFDASKKFYGGNAVVSGNLPIAVGMALASKKQKKNNITCCFFSEDDVSKCEFHEALNLAALWKVPILFICENNLYAMGNAVRYSHTVTNLEKKGIASSTVDGMNLIKVMHDANTAVEKVRSSGKPYLLICNTYRFRAYSMFDTELYRAKKEVEEWKRRDPIPQFEQFLLQQQWITENEITAFESKIKTKIQKALDFAEEGAREPLEQLTKFVYTKI
ncbi:pyruvate dehydrogenase (acetyl-transferring) E1 component subunit alpha [Flavobacterium ranwuense]|uniref:Pyruvate dehydrogenase E1 component subunit alpha n=1 Tax=Flavobacterium ranwuense TaxID=2541725 RepID=A0ABY2DQP2_9FLAO|nr:pyruvate dehydrogenase (acetyl-transferring) E1 component subunit alpha [Flavobacterium ranwuense]TDE28791.1 pyruvate dehydrogenase (acetyl-transferring) E1 component subunit alpha [Flavobacterium ranwuense]